jgi:hypothetical protein
MPRLYPVDRARGGQFDPGDGELPSEVHADTAGRVIQFEDLRRGDKFQLFFSIIVLQGSPLSLVVIFRADLKTLDPSSLRKLNLFMLKELKVPNSDRHLVLSKRVRSACQKFISLSQFPFCSYFFH